MEEFEISHLEGAVRVDPKGIDVAQTLSDIKHKYAGRKSTSNRHFKIRLR